MTNDPDISKGISLLSQIFDAAAIKQKYHENRHTGRRHDDGSLESRAHHNEFTVKLSNVQGDIRVKTNVDVNSTTQEVDLAGKGIEIDNSFTFEHTIDKEPVKKKINLSDIKELQTPVILTFSFKDPAGKSHQGKVDISDRSADELRLIANAAKHRNADFGM